MMGMRIPEIRQRNKEQLSYFTLFHLIDPINKQPDCYKL